ncbi:MAG: T9SS type A sorting domain-containing protein [Ignavibacteria bacterium]
MKYTLYKILFALIIINSLVFSQWVEQSSGTAQVLYGVYNFPSSNITICAGNNSAILRSTNNGTNWSPVAAPVLNRTLTSITGFGANTSWICGNGVIFKSTNSGAVWISQTVTNHFYFGISFINQNTGWLCGSVDSVFHTTNGGINWQASATGMPAGANYSGIQFIDNLTGYMYGSDSSSNGFIFKSTDGGFSWSQSFTSAVAVICFQMVNPSTGYAGNNLIYKTTNMGASWSTLSNPLITSLFGLKFPADASTGYAVSLNKILKTTNGGNSWYIFTGPVGDYLRSLCFKTGTNDTGFAVGNSGQILFTMNGGGSFTATGNIQTETPSGFSLSQNYPNPFNPSTSIEFTLPEAEKVSLKVFDATGKLVTEIIDHSLEAGTHEINFNASELSSGAYFYKLETKNFTDVKKMVLVK